jgi:WD40 repeat protein
MGFSDHSLSFCTAGGRSIKIWDGESGKLLRSYRDVVRADISRMSVSSDGRLCIVGDCEGGVAVINYATGQKVKALPGHIGSVQGTHALGFLAFVRLHKWCLASQTCRLLASMSSLAVLTA